MFYFMLPDHKSLVCLIKNCNCKIMGDYSANRQNIKTCICTSVFRARSLDSQQVILIDCVLIVIDKLLLDSRARGL